MKLKFLVFVFISRLALNSEISLTQPLDFNETLNPLPDSVLLSVDDFAVSEVIHLTQGEDDSGYADAIDFSDFGDIDGDGNPEIVVSAWDYSNCKNSESDTPLKSALRVFSADLQKTIMRSPESVFAKDYTDGTAFIRVDDFTGDAKNDVLIVSHNECPFFARPNVLFEGRESGFTEHQFLPSVAMHEGSVVDINLDGAPDIVGSAYTFDEHDINLDSSVYPDRTAVAAGRGIVIWINDGKGDFQAYKMAFDGAIENSKAENEANQKLQWIQSGSAVTAADLDGDGEVELVVVDGMTGPHSGTNYEESAYGSVHLVIDDIKYESKHAYGKIVPLPDSYHRQRHEKFENLSSNVFKRRLTHSIQVDTMDIDNDGDQDILVNTFIWVMDPKESTGILQIYRNDGDLQFTDVTDQSLFNFNISRQASHGMRIHDVNGDGYKDLLMVDGSYSQRVKKTWGEEPGGASPWEGDFYIPYPGTYTNDILINTGTGKFVSVAWEILAEVQGKKQAFYESYGERFEPWMMTSVKMHPYILSDNRLGYVFSGSGHRSERFYFDARATRAFSTGPNGTDPAERGVPGFSEYFYLVEYPDAAAAVSSGEFADGLEHYLAVGKAKGYLPHAPDKKRYSNLLNTLKGLLRR